MSKTCHECENCIYPPMCENTLCPISNETFAEMCGGFTPIKKSPKTLFNCITQSEEALAEKLVYYLPGVGWYFSTLFDGDTCWKTKAEAIAATVAKLREVKDE